MPTLWHSFLEKSLFLVVCESGGALQLHLISFTYTYTINQETVSDCRSYSGISYYKISLQNDIWLLRKYNIFMILRHFWAILGRFHGNTNMINHETVSDCRSYSGISYYKISLQNDIWLLRKYNIFMILRHFWAILGRFHGNTNMINHETVSDCRSYSGISYYKISLQNDIWLVRKYNTFMILRHFWAILGRFHGNTNMINHETVSDCRSYGGIS